MKPTPEPKSPSFRCGDCNRPLRVGSRTSCNRSSCHGRRFFGSDRRLVGGQRNIFCAAKCIVYEDFLPRHPLHNLPHANTSHRFFSHLRIFVNPSVKLYITSIVYWKNNNNNNMKPVSCGLTQPDRRTF